MLAKLEAANPLSSIKDRVALRMIEDAEASGALTPGATVIESTSGNTGIALAALAVSRGYPCVVVMPDNASRERTLTLHMLGARVEFTDHVLGFQGCVDRARSCTPPSPGPGTPASTRIPPTSWPTTRPQGRRSGPAPAARSTCWCAESGPAAPSPAPPATSASATPGCASSRWSRRAPPAVGGAPGPHRIPGLNGGFTSPVTDVTLIDDVITVPDGEAAAMTRLIAATTGLLVGVSSGAAAYGCAELARREDLSGQTVVTIFPDTGERYLSWWPA
ncbi:cysteine synthase A [Microbispora bryophytorum subsp. camponoti]